MWKKRSLSSGTAFCYLTVCSLANLFCPFFFHLPWKVSAPGRPWWHHGGGAFFFLHGVQLCPALGRRGGGVRRRALFSSCCCPLIKLSEQRRSERRGRQHKNSGGAKTLRPPRSIQPVILVQLKRVTSASPRSTNSFRHTDMIGTVWTGLRAVYFFAWTKCTYKNSFAMMLRTVWIQNQWYTVNIQ